MGVQALQLVSPKSSQSANQQVTKLISQTASQKQLQQHCVGRLDQSVI